MIIYTSKCVAGYFRQKGYIRNNTKASWKETAVSILYYLQFRLNIGCCQNFMHYFINHFAFLKKCFMKAFKNLVKKNNIINPWSYCYIIHRIIKIIIIMNSMLNMYIVSQLKILHCFSMHWNKLFKSKTSMTVYLHIWHWSALLTSKGRLFAEFSSSGMNIVYLIFQNIRLWSSSKLCFGRLNK